MKNEQDPVNALTVDVEEYFQVEAFADKIPVEHWADWDSRIERNTHRLLDLFAKFGVKGTFFILGWVAKHHPGLIREISRAGHEIACHGYFHRLIRSQRREEFREDIRTAKMLLEEITGRLVEGYRAPTYSITIQTLWALEILVEEGFRYDSSIFPVHHDRYGIPDAKRFPYVVRSASGEILEFPPSTVRMGGQNFPVAGGGYFRWLPYELFRWGIRRINRRERQSSIFMIHAWEIDPEQPVLPGSRLNILRHRANLHRTESRLERLLGDFRFAPAREVLRLKEEGGPCSEPLLMASKALYVQAD